MIKGNSVDVKRKINLFISKRRIRETSFNSSLLNLFQILYKNYKEDVFKKNIPEEKNFSEIFL